MLTAHLLFLAGFLCLGQMEEIQRNLQIKVPVAADSESRMIGIASRTSSGQRVVDCNELQRNSRYHLDMAELEDMAAPTVWTLSMVSARRVTSSASSAALSWSQPSGMVMVTLTVFRSISGMNTKPR